MHDEFRSIPHDAPRLMVRGLAIFAFLYGVALTFVLPVSVYNAAQRHSLGPLGIILALLGSLFLVRWCILQGLAFYALDRHYWNKDKDQADPAKWPFVSILVPAYNETDTIVSALNSLVKLNYPHYEVIVIDDGSSDETYAKALPLQADYDRCTVRVFTKPNGGKGSALNLAFEKSKGELVLCVDADSRLSPDTLKHMVRKSMEPGVVGVCGQVTIRNRDRLLTRFQAVEYLGGNGGMRAAMSAIGTVTIVPGPIGLYKRTVMEEVAKLPCNDPKYSKDVGPLSGETFAEDFQLSLSVLALGGRIVYEPRAIAYTKCPETIDILISQRYRWMRGTFQVLHIYMRDLRRIAIQKSKALDRVMLLIYPVDVYCTPILNFMFWMGLAISAGMGMPLGSLAFWIAAVAFLNIMTTAVFVLVHDDEFKNLPLLFIQDVYQTILINSAWVIAAIDEYRGSKMRWS